MFEALDLEQHPYLSEFIVTTHPTELTTLLVINLKASFEVYFVDFRKNQRVINVLRSMSDRLLTSTRGSHAFAVDLNEDFGIFTLATSNKNFMCFSARDGSFIEARSALLCNQSITANRRLFASSLMSKWAINEGASLLQTESIF